MRNKLIISVALIVLTLGVFWPVMRFEFVDFDDFGFVTFNPHVQKGLTAEEIRWAFENLWPHWMPLTWISYMADSAVWGLNPGGFHLTNLLLHLTSTLLLFWLLTRVTNAVWQSAFVAALFAVHPLHVETVAWIADRKGVLSTVFFMLTLSAYVSYVRGSLNELNRFIGTKWISYGLALLFFAFGLMSKAVLVTLPFVLLLLDFWPLGRVKFKVESSKFKVRENLPLLLEKAPFFALAAVSCIVAIKAQDQAGSLAPNEMLSFGHRVCNAIVAYGWYLLKLFWPTDLAVFYPHPGSWPSWNVVLSGAVLLVVSDWAMRKSRGLPYVAVGWLWYLGTLVPVIGFLHSGEQAFADRYTYIPLIGLFVVIAWGAGDLIRTWNVRSQAVAVAGLCVVVGCAAVSVQQVQHWRNTRTLFERAKAVTRDNYLAYTVLGNVLAREGKVDQAVAHYRQSLQWQPDYADTRYNLGNAFSMKGDWEQAAEEYQRAVKVDSHNWERRMKLAHALHRIGRIDEAISNYHEALKLRPNSPQTKHFLGIALASRGNHEQALQLFREAAELQPRWPATIKAMAGSLVQLGKTNEAMAQCEEALKAAPEDPECHVLMAQLLDQMNDDQKAIRHYRMALRLDPDAAGTLNNLAWLLATHPDDKLRNGAEAVQLAEKACQETEYKVPLLIGTLATAYAEAKRFEEAVKMAEKAAALSREQGQTELASVNEKLAELYRSGRRYCEQK